ncbi:MAG: hypothetical protein WHS83_16830, partial [Chloroflexus sp.]
LLTATSRASRHSPTVRHYPLNQNSRLISFVPAEIAYAGIAGALMAAVALWYIVRRLRAGG